MGTFIILYCFTVPAFPDIADIAVPFTIGIMKLAVTVEFPISVTVVLAESGAATTALPVTVQLKNG